MIKKDSEAITFQSMIKTVSNNTMRNKRSNSYSKGNIDICFPKNNSNGFTYAKANNSNGFFKRY
jgi:hypothetical protein